ncbi:hypothetical protein AVEN_184728-1 [Araneus ventricosus]|uniref:Uncharacterized protein n=1 Tax=Araneus ventricosus TaxID=182803 RepID=A0A4Y2B1Q4_ARAVE|nr:hypothetical protein AVEN_184728-1 [Araneus ventricosus]
MKIPQRIIYDVVDVRIQSLENPRNSLQFEALVTDTITGSQINFAHKVTRSSLEKRGIRLADREAYRHSVLEQSTIVTLEGSDWTSESDATLLHIASTVRHAYLV